MELTRDWQSAGEGTRWAAVSAAEASRAAASRTAIDDRRAMMLRGLTLGTAGAADWRLWGCVELFRAAARSAAPSPASALGARLSVDPTPLAAPSSWPPGVFTHKGATQQPQPRQPQARPAQARATSKGRPPNTGARACNARRRAPPRPRAEAGGARRGPRARPIGVKGARRSLHQLGSPLGPELADLWLNDPHAIGLPGVKLKVPLVVVLWGTGPRGWQGLGREAPAEGST
jgi:hypothetical protein